MPEHGQRKACAWKMRLLFFRGALEESQIYQMRHPLAAKN